VQAHLQEHLTQNISLGWHEVESSSRNFMTNISIPEIKVMLK